MMLPMTSLDRPVLLTALVLALAAPALGCKKDGETPPAGKTIVAVTADDKGFTPSAVDVKQGEPTAIGFTRTSDDTCATEVVFPELDLKKSLPKDKTVYVVVPTDTARTYTFTCGMGMYKSSVVIK